MQSERIAVLTIGKSKVFQIAKSIANSLDIPYISINPDSPNNSDEPTIINKKSFELNLHPAPSKIMASLIDIIHYYKWEIVYVLFQEPSRVEDLIRYAESSGFQHTRVHFRLISQNIMKWRALLKFVKETGASNLIIDIETKYITAFLKLVSI